ncbi:MAG: hypothetical protein ACYTHN_04695 [Planctomycetota bacterium]
MLAVALLCGFKGLSIAIGVFGGLFLLGGGWGLLRIGLGRSDHLLLSDESLDYVHPVHPDRNRTVPLQQVSDVSIGVGEVGRVKEMKVSVAMKDGTTWTFGERFMDSRLLKVFMEDLQDRLRRLP